MKRRQFIKTLAAGTIAGGVPAVSSAMELQPTPPQSEGPFYPVTDIPLTEALYKTGHLGEKLEVSGRILNLDGTAVPSARLEIWQCDAQGIYRHPRDYRYSKIDRGFTGYAARLTNDEGSYQFKTIMPVPYSGRPPHIHLKVMVDKRHYLTTQLYLKGKRGPRSLKINPVVNEKGGYTATYDFVLNRLG